MALVPRLFDLLAVVRKNYYHPAFADSFSIKKTLPALVPNMSYAGMSVADGPTAVTRVAKAALGLYSQDEIAVVREQLLRYCEQDTLAMVKLHEALLKAAQPS